MIDSQLSMFIYAVLVIALIALIKQYYRYRNYWKARGVSGPAFIPIFGNLLDNFRTPINILEIERCRKYGKIYGFFEMSQPVICVTDIDLLKQMSIRDAHIFTNHMNMSPGDPLLSKLLFNLEDDEWKRVRNIATPAFTSSKIKQMFALITKCVDNSRSYFETVAKEKKEINLKKTFTSYAIDVIAACIFGAEINSYKDPNGEFVRAIQSVTDFATIRVFIGFLMPTILRQALGFQLFDPTSVEYMKKILKHVIMERKGTESDHKDFVKLLLDSEINKLKDLQKFGDEEFTNAEAFEVLDVNNNKRKLDDDEILAQCLSMFIAGIETISTGLSYLFWILATRSDIQEKLYEEIHEYFDTEENNYDSLVNLPFLEAVLSETLRRFSPVIQTDHVCKADYKLADTGIVIPKGTLLNMPFHAIHHDPEYWPEPFEFKPERFLPENKHLIKPYTYLAYGIGPRICIGMKLGMIMVKAIVAQLVYNFEILKSPKTVAEPIFSGKKFVAGSCPLYVTLRSRNG